MKCSGFLDNGTENSSSHFGDVLDSGRALTFHDSDVANVTFMCYVNVGTDYSICVDQVSNIFFSGKSQKSSLDFSVFLSSSRSIPDDLIPRPSTGSAANISCTILR